jgi:hypothetical protein
MSTTASRIHAIGLVILPLSDPTARSGFWVSLAVPRGRRRRRLLDPTRCRVDVSYKEDHNARPDSTSCRDERCAVR